MGARDPGGPGNMQCPIPVPSWALMPFALASRWQGGSGNQCPGLVGLGKAEAHLPVSWRGKPMERGLSPGQQSSTLFNPNEYWPGEVCGIWGLLQSLMGGGVRVGEWPQLTGW
jgi:hypothetical protein